MTPTRRQKLLKQMLTDAPASTQHALVEMLHQSGIDVTQATVSRDLTALGAVRGPDGYRLPEQPPGLNGTAVSPTQDARLRAVISEHALTITQAGSIVVVRTAPGHANFVASEIDATRPKGMVGCLAGDDTIFIATPTNTSAARLVRTLNSMIGGPS